MIFHADLADFIFNLFNPLICGYIFISRRFKKDLSRCAQIIYIKNKSAKSA